ncbi:VWA domain-containing protein [Pseudofrankia sp. BMG5.36]|uniref:VWA domain-containing protein n=1 Tax=Pseudofrankia sp. BMG5.36 TaxID=1834512 RepID=UPI0008DA047D|nr:VWA domain-containing protein [Pseudofrankia sp. BMG5.36]OHV59279.1 hypothetical protein BCD48_41505 [Pseudofrankia sp. BMG5.36]
MLVFTSEVNQNKYLPAGGTDVHAVVTVTAKSGGQEQGQARSQPGGRTAAEVILLDCSGSMGGNKIIEARRAARAAIDTLSDGVLFAVVQGEHFAKKIFPERDSLAVASAATREAAKTAVSRMQAGGGTAIGEWLLLARELMLTRPDAIHHAILLTDGQNGQTEAELDRALNQCEGVFQCDCRGVGADWEVAQLRRIAKRLLGDVGLIRKPNEMADDFRAIVEAALGRGIDKVALRVWTPRGADVLFLRQVLPDVTDLTGGAVAVDALTRDYPTGAWGEEKRVYHLGIKILPGPVGVEKLSARVRLVVDGEPLAEAKVLAAWTDDVELSTRIDGTVAHYTGQAELADAIQKGLEARNEGDGETAATLLGQAARLATRARDTARLALLEKVVEIEDAATGKVKLRANVDKLDEMDLDAQSTKTVPAPR